MKKLIVITAALFIAGNLMAAPIKNKFVHVGEEHFWTEQSGQGKPTIVLINGTGKGLSSWNAFVPSLAKLGTVFAYDRAGLGKSLPLKNQVAIRSAQYIVGRMRSVLQAADLKPPYILVSDSIGTLYARYFARTFSSEVQGMVLVNPMVNAAIALGEIKDSAKTKDVAQAIFRQQYNKNFHGLKQNHQNLLKSYRYQPSQTQAARIENYLELLGETKSERQIINAAPLRAIPVVIMEGKQQSDLETAMLKQIVAQTPKGHYQYLPYKSDDLQKISANEMTAAVKRVLS
jgi:alpha-beta hydrolase superfamily lysophospholipase